MVSSKGNIVVLPRPEIWQFCVVFLILYHRGVVGQQRETPPQEPQALHSGVGAEGSIMQTCRRCLNSCHKWAGNVQAHLACKHCRAPRNLLSKLAFFAAICGEGIKRLNLNSDEYLRRFLCTVQWPSNDQSRKTLLHVIAIL